LKQKPVSYEAFCYKNSIDLRAIIDTSNSIPDAEV